VSSHPLHPETPLPGKLFVLVGPPGAGKNTLIDAAIARAGVRQLPTATTRARRPNEIEGIQHYFVSLERFHAMIADGELLEYQQVHGTERYYGIVREPLLQALSAGEYLVADIDIKGVESVRAAFPANVVPVFITVAHLCELRARLAGRSETEAEIARRLLRVPLEMAYMSACPYVIVNDDPARASAALNRIIEAVRAGHPCQLERPPQLRFRYEVEFTIVHADQRLVRAGSQEGLVVAFTPQEYPHRSARALADLLDGQFDPDALIGGGPIESDGFLPPVELLCWDEGALEVMRYRYQYPVAARFDAPAGWEWQPVLPAAQPVSLAAAAYA
jgi:guanylate kinase